MSGQGGPGDTGSILRKHQTDEARLPGPTARDQALSLRARGLLLFLFAQPDGYPVNAAAIAAELADARDTDAPKIKEGREAVESAIKELAHYGYLDRRREQNDHGRWRTVTDVYPSPRTAGQTDYGSAVVGGDETAGRADYGSTGAGSPVAKGSTFPSLQAVATYPSGTDVRSEGEGKAPRPTRPPRVLRHPSDAFVLSRMRQIQAESGVTAARAYRRTVEENYGPVEREELLRRMRAAMTDEEREQLGGAI